MNHVLEIIPIGNAAGVILPQELLASLGVMKGDQLLVTETPNGIELSPSNPEVARQMKVAERVMREDREVLRRLAE